MKTSSDCLVCYLRQVIQVARVVGSSPDKEQECILAVAEMLKSFDMKRTPPEHAIEVYEKISKVLGVPDPYSEIKAQSNKDALELLPVIREQVKKANDSLMTAIRFSIAGNIIDYGAADTFNVDALMEKCQTIRLAVDDSNLLKERFSTLRKYDKVLYLLDNCGEIVYDKLVLDYLHELGVVVTIVARGGAIINDSTVEDAMSIGLDTYGDVVSSGLACPGTPINLCSDVMLKRFEDADLVISKGQGNFETLSELKTGKILFLLTVKCRTVGEHFSEITGVEPKMLPGKGEMAIYFPQD